MIGISPVFEELGDVRRVISDCYIVEGLKPGLSMVEIEAPVLRSKMW